MKSRPYIRARDSDSLVGDVFGEPVLTEAEAEHRGIRPVEVDLALLDLSEVLEEVRRRAHVTARRQLVLRRAALRQLRRCAGDYSPHPAYLSTFCSTALSRRSGVSSSGRSGRFDHSSPQHAVCVVVACLVDSNSQVAADYGREALVAALPMMCSNVYGSSSVVADSSAFRTALNSTSERRPPRFTLARSSSKVVAHCECLDRRSAGRARLSPACGR